MAEYIFQKLAQLIYIPKLRRAEQQIGYRLVFKDIPDRYIQGWVSWDETQTWNQFGLNLQTGVNYWTIGKVMNGMSSRFDRKAPEYQSWLGGYIVRLAAKQDWTVDDHFKLAIADQNSWLKSYGDPKPLTSIEGWEFTPVGEIHSGQFTGTLYQGGCTTHSDVGGGYNKFRLWLESLIMAALFNFTNPNLSLTSKAFYPPSAANPYETLKLRGYIAIFNLEENVKVMLYGVGAIIPTENGQTDIFLTLKDDLLKAMRSCEIIKL